jgi:hypothetical protein
LITVVTAVSNPLGWQTRARHYRAFRDNVLAAGARLIVVEAKLGSRPWEFAGDERVTHIAVRHKTLLWHKENLLNLGIMRALTDAIGWFDADTEHRRKDIVPAIEDALQQYPVVQTFSDAINLGPQGEPLCIKGSHVRPSFAKVWVSSGSTAKWRRADDEPLMKPHPGYAWAARRSTLDEIGLLLDKCVAGSADLTMALAMVGRVDEALNRRPMTPAHRDSLRPWCERAAAVVKGNLGFVQGTIEHFYHGEPANRQHDTRDDMLVEHDFDPSTDLRLNIHGVLELTGKPALERAFDRFLRARCEDQNVRMTRRNANPLPDEPRQLR